MLYRIMNTFFFRFCLDDARRSKESIVNQNQMNRQDKQVTFNHKQQHSQQQHSQQQRIFDDVVSIRPSKQYTPQQNKQPELPQSIPSSSTRVKITSTTQAYVTSRPTVAVASQSKQSNYYSKSATVWDSEIRILVELILSPFFSIGRQWRDIQRISQFKFL